MLSKTRKMKVLVVDNETEFASTLAERLRLRKIEAKSVYSGEETGWIERGGWFSEFAPTSPVLQLLYLSRYSLCVCIYFQIFPFDVQETLSKTKFLSKYIQDLTHHQCIVARVYSGQHGRTGCFSLRRAMILMISLKFSPIEILCSGEKE